MGRRFRVQCPGVVHERVQKKIAISPSVQLIKKMHQGARVTGPEYDNVHILGFQRDA